MLVKGVVWEMDRMRSKTAFQISKSDAFLMTSRESGRYC